MKPTIIILVLLLVAGLSSAQDVMPRFELPPGDTPPPDVFRRIQDAGTEEDHDGASYVIAYESTTNRVNQLGVTLTDSYVLYKVLTENGCNQLSVIRQGYEPLSNIVEFKEINIVRGDSLIGVDLSTTKDLPAPQSGIYWADRLIMIQLPRLEVGDGIEVRYERKGYSYALLDDDVKDEDGRFIPPMPGQYFDIVLFESDVPIIEKRYELKLPADKRLHSEVYNGTLYSSTTYNSDTTTYAWWIKDVEAFKSERYTPDPSDYVTKVVLATVESWEAKSRWFFQVNEGQFDVTPEIQAKVDEILSAAGVTNGTDEEKAFELVHWVAQNIRYSGQTMGEGEGFTLHPGSMIFEQRSGVCKDIAGMLVTMMRAADLDSYAAMTMAGSRIETVPADQFNHCVVALRTDDGKFVMYDPTWVPFDKDIWSKLETEQHYLIGTPDGESLDRIRYSPPEESPMHVVSNARILENGELRGTFELRADGAADHYLRGLDAWFFEHEVERFWASMLHHLSNRIEIESIDHGDPLDFKKGMWWKVQYRVPDYAMLIDDGIEFESPMMSFTMNNRLIFRAAGYDWPEKRDNDLFFYFTEHLDGKEKITLPSGFSIESPPESEEVDETYAYFIGKSELSGRTLSITQNAMLKRRQVPPDGYPGFYKMISEAKDFAEVVFRAEKGGAK